MAKTRSQKEADLADRLNSDYRARRRMAKRERSSGAGSPKRRVIVRVRRTRKNTPEGAGAVVGPTRSRRYRDRESYS